MYSPLSVYIYIYIYCYYYLLLLFNMSPFIPFRNLYNVYTYNHIALMSLRIGSHVKASIVLTKADV